MLKYFNGSIMTRVGDWVERSERKKDARIVFIVVAFLIGWMPWMALLMSIFPDNPNGWWVFFAPYIYLGINWIAYLLKD